MLSPEPVKVALMLTELWEVPCVSRISDGVADGNISQPFCHPPVFAATVIFALRVIASLRALVMAITRSVAAAFTLLFANISENEGMATVINMPAMATVMSSSIRENPATGRCNPARNWLRVRKIDFGGRVQFMMTGYQQPVAAVEVALLPVLSRDSVPH